MSLICSHITIQGRRADEDSYGPPKATGEQQIGPKPHSAWSGPLKRVLERFRMMAAADHRCQGALTAIFDISWSFMSSEVHKGSQLPVQRRCVPEMKTTRNSFILICSNYTPPSVLLIPLFFSRHKRVLPPNKAPRHSEKIVEVFSPGSQN